MHFIIVLPPWFPWDSFVSQLNDIPITEALLFYFPILDTCDKKYYIAKPTLLKAYSDSDHEICQNLSIFIISISYFTLLPAPSNAEITSSAEHTASEGFISNTFST